MEYKIKSKLFTFSEIEYLVSTYQRIDINKLTEVFNKKYNRSMKKSQIRSFLKNHKITCGRTGCFEKGNIPWTVGVAGKGIIKPNSGSFKKGITPMCHRPVGSERINVDGYIEIKIAEPATWHAKHRVVWMKSYGSIPKGHNIRMRDGNKLNIDIDNLCLVSNSEHMILNQLGFVSAAKEIQQVMMTLAKVKSKAYQLRQQ